jgi:subtilisin family serine protease
MRRFPAVLSLLVFFAAVSGAAQAAGEFVPGEILVKVRGGVSPQAIAGIQADANADGDEHVADVGDAQLRKLHIRGNVADALKALSGNSSVEYAQPNYILHADLTPNDTRYGELWGMKNTGQPINAVPGKAGADISAEAAWSVTTGSPSLIVGVVDTGIDYNHPDLAANIWSNPGGVGGCAVGTHGYNAITKTCDPADDHYHGTHCAGTIGAIGNNGLGVVGVNWNVKIMGLKFLDAAGSGTTADAIAAIDFGVQAKVAGQNLRVLSNSWGGGAFDQALMDEINKANTNNILFVAAAGNAGTNNDVTPHYPSSYNTPNMVAVAATDNSDALASFSCFGATTVHLGAPGVDILSTQPGGLYQYLSGTSMATPHVAGAAALVLAAQPTLTTAQLKSALLNNVDPIPSLSGKTVTGGRLNVAKAVGGTPPPPPPPPASDFSVSASPSSQSVVQGASTTYSVTITRTSFTAAVSLSVTGLPAGATGSFNPASTTGTTSTLTVATATTTATGSYPLTITGTSGSTARTASVTLVVTSAAPPPPTCVGGQGDC